MAVDVLMTGFNALESVGLSAAAGLRIFMPLSALMLVGYFLEYPLHKDLMWLLNPWVIVFITSLALIELTLYYIPYLGHLINIFTIPLSVLAGVVIFSASFVEAPSESVRWPLALIVGGAAAGVTQALSVIVRSISLQTSGGLSHSFIATSEWVGALTLVLVAVFIPALLVVILLALYGLARWTYIQQKHQKEFEDHLMNK